MKQKKISLCARRLYLIVNITPQSDSKAKILGRLINAGVDMVQLRAKGISDELFLQLAKAMRKTTQRCGIPLIINDRPDIAFLSGADGVHLGQDDIAPQCARKILGEHRIIGLSTHMASEVSAAFRNRDVDYIGIGPIFKTQTKPLLKPIGHGIIRTLFVEKSRLPFYAIGGITPENIGAVINAGARCAAVSSSILGAENPAEVIRRFRDILYDTD